MMQFISDNWWMFGLGAIGSYLIGFVGWCLTFWFKDGHSTSSVVGTLLGAFLAFVFFLIVSNICWIAFIIGVVCQIILFASKA